MPGLSLRNTNYLAGVERERESKEMRAVVRERWGLWSVVDIVGG